MKKSLFIIITFSLFFSSALVAQSAEKVEEILNSENLTKGQACYLLGCLNGSVNLTDSYDIAFEKFSVLKMFKGEKAEENIRLDEFSYLLADNFNPKSLWWKASKHPHYAFRYLKKIGAFDYKKPASSNIKPDEALNLLSRFSDEFVFKQDSEGMGGKNEKK